MQKRKKEKRAVEKKNSIYFEIKSNTLNGRKRMSGKPSKSPLNREELNTYLSECGGGNRHKRKRSSTSGRSDVSSKKRKLRGKRRERQFIPPHESQHKYEQQFLRSISIAERELDKRIEEENEKIPDCEREENDEDAGGSSTSIDSPTSENLQQPSSTGEGFEPDLLNADERFQWLYYSTSARVNRRDSHPGGKKYKRAETTQHEISHNEERGSTRTGETHQDHREDLLKAIACPYSEKDRRGKHTKQSRLAEQEHFTKLREDNAVPCCNSQCAAKFLYEFGSYMDLANPTEYGLVLNRDKEFVCTRCGVVQENIKTLEDQVDSLGDASISYHHKNYFAERCAQFQNTDPRIPKKHRKIIRQFYTTLLVNHSEELPEGFPDWGNIEKLQKHHIRYLLTIIGSSWRRKYTERWLQIKIDFLGIEFYEMYVHRLPEPILIATMKRLFDLVCHVWQNMKKDEAGYKNIPRLDICFLIMLYNLQKLQDYGWYFISEAIHKQTKAVLRDYRRYRKVFSILNKPLYTESQRALLPPEQDGKWIVPKRIKTILNICQKEIDLYPFPSALQTQTINNNNIETEDGGVHRRSDLKQSN